MSRAVVAIEAGVIGSFCRKLSRLAHMTGRALFFEDRMSTGQAAAAVHAGITGQAFFSDPRESKQQQHNAEPKLGALERCRPLEIVEVDALREIFSCACASHNKSS